MSRIYKSLETKEIGGYQGRGGGENGEKLLNGHRVSIWDDENVLEPSRGCGYTTLGMY